jgi:DNA replication licensing factor MCM2
VTGIYTNNYDTALNRKHGFPVFATVIEANYVARRDAGTLSASLSDDDRREIARLSKTPNIAEKARCLSLSLVLFVG